MPILLPFLETLPPIRNMTICNHVLDALQDKPNDYSPEWGYMRIDAMYGLTLHELRTAIPELNTSQLLLERRKINFLGQGTRKIW